MHLFSRAAAILAAALPSAAQDTPGSGFALSQAPNPAAANPLAAMTTLSGGDIVVFDGLQVTRHSADGALVRVLGTLPLSLFPSFVLADPSESRLYIGESSNGGIYKLFLETSATPDLITTLAFNYDAAMSTDRDLFVSAATCGLVCGSEVWRVDLGSNQATLVARTPGPSGPLAFDSAGNLYYGTVSPLFPPPSGASDVWRWSAARLEGPDVLDLDDATMIGSGFSGASRLAHDPRTGWLYLMENNFGTGENRIRRLRGSAATSPVLVEGRPFRSMGNLALRPGAGTARFRTFQPESGGTLTYTSTDFVASNERFAVRPQRPTATLVGPGLVGPGPFKLELRGGPPNGLASLWICALGDFHPIEQAFHVGPLPVFLGLEPGSLSSLPGLLRLDAAGGLDQDYLNPGGWEGTSALQLLLFEPPLRPVGSSSAAFL